VTTPTRSKRCKEPPYSGVQLLTRAYHLIEAGPLEGKVCTAWCPWCALDEAHRQLELEHEIKLPLHRVLTRLVKAIFDQKGWSENQPLIDSKIAMESWKTVFHYGITREEALFVLRRAGAWVE